MNQITLMGRLTSSPKINDSLTVASFHLAVDRPIKNQDGTKAVDFIPCKCLGGKMVMFANKYLHKGIKVAVTGYLRIDNFNQDGVRKSYAYVITNSIEFCESKAAQAAQQQEERKKPDKESEWESLESVAEQEELPFT